MGFSVYSLFLTLIFMRLLFPQEASASSDLLNDLLIVEYWNREMEDRLPVTYNHLFYAGYLNMPSARMSREGILGAGMSYVPPYHQYNLYCQLTPFLEISGNYRVFRGVDDPILTPLGFGDMSDKGANVKLSIFRPEDSNYILPGLAVGMDGILEVDADEVGAGGHRLGEALDLLTGNEQHGAGLAGRHRTGPAEMSGHYAASGKAASSHHAPANERFAAVPTAGGGSARDLSQPGLTASPAAARICPSN